MRWAEIAGRRMLPIPGPASVEAMSTAAAPASALTEWVRPGPGARGIRNDLLLAFALAIGTTASVLLYRAAGVFAESPGWAVTLWIIAISMPIAVRRVYPEAVAIFVSMVFVAGAIAETTDALFANICLFIAIYTLGAWGRRRRLAVAIRVVIIVGMFVWLFWALLEAAGQPDAMPDFSRVGTLSPYLAFSMVQILTNLLYFGGAYYFGESAHRAAASKAQLVERTRELAEERERTQAQAIALERVRIARELHDVVAHHVSVMGVQAGAARRVLDSQPHLAREALTVIEGNARSAVDELHQLLGTLRSDDQDAPAPSDAASTRGVKQLPELVEEVTTNGLPTALVIVGEPRHVPATIGLILYRIAQESLTNSRKHAGADARAELRLRYEASVVELEASDTGIGGASRLSGAASGTGLGQLGMRERVSAAGGTIEIGPRARGGYLVRTRLPLHPVAATPAATTEPPTVEPTVAEVTA